MKFLTREEILAADDLAYKDIEVKEWGGHVRIRALRGVDRAELTASFPKGEDATAPSDWIERLLIACLTDEKGNQLFTAADLKELGKKNSKILQTLFDAADELNVLTGGSLEQLKGE